MQKYHVRLKAATFHSSKLIKMLSEDKFYLHSLIMKHKYSLEVLLPGEKMKLV